jgi:hypothetical protein
MHFTGTAGSRQAGLSGSQASCDDRYVRISAAGIEKMFSQAASFIRHRSNPQSHFVRGKCRCVGHP